MSQEQINRNPDLKRLQDEGYNIEIRAVHLLVKDVPYVTETREVKYGTIVSPLTGDITESPVSDHTVRFTGECPCDKNGIKLTQIINETRTYEILPGVVVNHSFSSKPPPPGYKDYFEKMTTYVNILLGHAIAIDPTATAKTGSRSEVLYEESVFNYPDTASSIAGITAISAKLSTHKVAIVGLGGTGSYLLDFLAKTHVKEIHLYDGDNFENKNAFRTPGAHSDDDMKRIPKKVDYLYGIYSRMRKNIFPHPYYIDESNIQELGSIGFVFLCIDNVQVKRTIVNRLKDLGIPFIDCGMGINSVENKLGGIIRVTTCIPDNFDGILKHPLDSDDKADEYTKNIQIAELNALNAALAVIKWKKLCGYYSDFRNEHYMTYTIDGNTLLNEECS
jgi:hypothetical protein